MKKKIAVFKAFMLLAFASMALFACNNDATTETLVIRITGRLPLVFRWYDARIDCPECAQIYAIVNTPEKGDFDYGPYSFDFNGVILKDVLSGENRTVTVWATDAGGNTIYRGVIGGIGVIADKTNNPVNVNLYPRGWYKQSPAQPGVNWELRAVRTVGEIGWIAGNDFGNSRGAIYRGAELSWSLQSLTVTQSNDWRLYAIDGVSTWTAGEDLQHGGGIILRYDGAIWKDDVVEPAYADPWRLHGISFDAGGIGWAVGETDTLASHDPVVLKYSSNVWAAATAPAGAISLYDVFAFGGGDALMCGLDNGSGNGALLLWDASAANYVDYAAGAGVANPWELKDVHGFSTSDWWAAGTEHGLNDAGIVIRYTTAGGLVVEYPTGPSGDWTLEGIWANASGEAWAVGLGDDGAILMHRTSAGVWSQVDPDNGALGWKLYGVDINADGWGFAVGVDTSASQGLILKYPFPE